jgi:hypothetical protein
MPEANACVLCSVFFFFFGIRVARDERDTYGYISLFRLAFDCIPDTSAWMTWLAVCV